MSNAITTASRVFTPIVGRWFERVSRSCVATARDVLPAGERAIERVRTWLATERELIEDLFASGHAEFMASRAAPAVGRTVEAEQPAAANGQRAA
jgi:hypothetical protein